MNVKNFTVEEVPRKSIVKFIEKHHYSHNVNGVQSLYHYGLFTEGNFGLPKMIGAMMYAHPSMPATAAKYNPINPDKCLELRRLVCIDDTPKNTESYFIGKTFKLLKQTTDKEVIVSFADQHHGHTGVIYKATNFDYLGETKPGRILMVDGKEMHSRSLNQLDRPYGRELNRRYKAGDENIFWKNTKPKHIYTYYLNKKIKREIKKLDLYNKNV
jgi:hypothetical protein|tara:strand:+ start:2643 stop:3284 length:642 start_codon:yes stop_codon:yes gene_type:complete